MPRQISRVPLPSGKGLQQRHYVSRQQLVLADRDQNFDTGEVETSSVGAAYKIAHHCDSPVREKLRFWPSTVAGPIYRVCSLNMFRFQLPVAKTEGGNDVDLAGFDFVQFVIAA